MNIQKLVLILFVLIGIPLIVYGIFGFVKGTFEQPNGINLDKSLFSTVNLSTEQARGQLVGMMFLMATMSASFIGLIFWAAYFGNNRQQKVGAKIYWLNILILTLGTMSIVAEVNWLSLSLVIVGFSGFGLIRYLNEIPYVEGC